jgi:serine/threonine protein kinase/Tfp pilus assembly protein PilF
MPADISGTNLGHYRVLRRLGRGGMGEVYEAEDTRLRRRVALKRLIEAPDGTSGSLSRLRREAEALAAINHPNVVTVHAVEEEDGATFVVMELVDGRTLSELLPDTGFEMDRLFELALPIVAALEAAHSRGVLHRDLKPSNVMVTPDGRVKVVDFGLAKLLEEGRESGDTRWTTTVGVVGTAPYMSLERLVGDPADRKSDLYSMGVLLFEMATGRLPFESKTMAGLIRRLLQESAPSARTFRPDVPEALDRLMSDLLTREPAARPGSAGEVIEALRRCAHEGKSPAAERSARPAAPPPHPTRPLDLEVVQLVARGRRQWNKRSEASLRDALASFQQAIDRDPMYAPAWIGVADSLNMLANYGFVPSRDSKVRATAAVERAIELEGETSEALRALALAAWQFDFDWTRADSLYRRAVELDPGSAISHYWHGVMLCASRRFDEGLAKVERAEALDPLSLIVPAARGWFTLFSGRADEGHAILRRVLTVDAALWPAWWFDGQTLSALGRYDEAIAAFERAIELGGRTSRVLAYQGHALGLAGRADEAQAHLDELRRRQADLQYVPPYFEALILLGLGRTEDALAQLETAVRERDAMARDLGVDPPWWVLRGEERYAVLRSAINVDIELG